FSGFCSFHDQTLFSPFENHVFSMSQEQIFLLAYRALCYELYTKRALVNSIPALKELDKGRGLENQLYIQSFTNVFSHGALVGLEQTIYYKEKFDEALIARKYDAIRYYCLELDRVQEVMGSGGFNPE